MFCESRMKAGQSQRHLRNASAGAGTALIASMINFKGGEIIARDATPPLQDLPEDLQRSHWDSLGALAEKGEVVWSIPGR